jgi:putative SOS response-associated peptidase YedK
MCGRATLVHDGNEIRTVFRLSDEYAKHMELRARYNVAPGTDIAAIKAGEPRVLTPMRWGLIPSWAKDAKIGYSMINARGETVPEKPAFRSAFKKRRCIIPVRRTT